MMDPRTENLQGNQPLRRVVIRHGWRGAGTTGRGSFLLVICWQRAIPTDHGAPFTGLVISRFRITQVHDPDPITQFIEFCKVCRSAERTVTLRVIVDAMVLLRSLISGPCSGVPYHGVV